MEPIPTPIGKGIITVLGLAGAISLHNINIWLSTASALVSLVAGLLTVCILARKLWRK